MYFNQRENYRVQLSIRKSCVSWRNKQFYHPSSPTNRRNVTSSCSVKRIPLETTTQPVCSYSENYLDLLLHCVTSWLI